MIPIYNLFESINSNINDPDDLLKLTSPIQYDNFTDEEKYIIKSPEQVLKSKKAICYDLVELERYYFKKIKYEFKTFFAYENLPITENPTHTFLVFKENNKYFWFESSWQSYKAIHGPFTSYDDAVKYVEKNLKWKSFNVKEYKEFNYHNMNISQ